MINFQHYTCILSEVSVIHTDLISAFHKRMRLFCFMGNGDCWYAWEPRINFFYGLFMVFICWAISVHTEVWLRIQEILGWKTVELQLHTYTKNFHFMVCKKLVLVLERITWINTFGAKIWYQFDISKFYYFGDMVCMYNLCMFTLH